MTRPLTVIPVTGLPEIKPGDDLGAMIAAVADLQDGDVVVVAQKIVSKAEGALEHPRPGESGDAARRRIARDIAAEVVADAPWALIVRTRHGFVCANAGIDASNVADGALTMLPDDPDASARTLREKWLTTGVDVAVIVADTFGRPWRVGQTDVAIGVAGLRPLRDERGHRDRGGAPLEVTEPAVADALAGAADLVRRKADGVPVVIVRGFDYEPSAEATARDLVRDTGTDLFPYGAGMLAARLARPWRGGTLTSVTDQDLMTLRRVADLTIVDPGPPTRLAIGDAFAAGLAAAAAVDLGLAVRWHADGDRVILEMGRTTQRR